MRVRTLENTTIFLIVSIILVSFVLSEPANAIQRFIYKSGSMTPTIVINDIINVNDTIPFTTIKIGDIIAFRASDPVEENKVIVHRVSAIIENSNNLTGNVILCAPIQIDEVIQEKTVLTKGDANECSIPGIDFPITEDNYMGKLQQVNWTTYRNISNDISFQYPEDWELNYSGKNESLLSLSNLPYTDSISISRFDQNHSNFSNNFSLKDFANGSITNVYGVTIIEPFTEKTINGLPAAMGKIVEEKLIDDKIQGQIKDVILTQDKGRVYKIEYSDNVNNYNEVKKDEILKRLLLSFNISH